jgi:hypothetical protein
MPTVDFIGRRLRASSPDVIDAAVISVDMPLRFGKAGALPTC